MLVLAGQLVLRDLFPLVNSETPSTPNLRSEPQKQPRTPPSLAFLDSAGGELFGLDQESAHVEPRFGAEWLQSELLEAGRPASQNVWILRLKLELAPICTYLHRLSRQRHVEPPTPKPVLVQPQTVPFRPFWCLLLSQLAPN